MILRYRNLAAVVACAVLWVTVTAVAAEIDPYTASPERRAELLAKVRDRDRERQAALARGPALTIVEDGKPVATIVARPTDAVAAKLLQEWLKLMSNVELPITEERPPAGAVIYVGKAAEEAGLKVDDIKSPSGEGLRIRCDGKAVFIGAQHPTAVFRAVGRFLEETFGCRYFDYTESGKVYPESKTLKVPTHEFAEAPAFTFRTVWGAEGAFGNYQGFKGAGAWRYWNGEGGTGIPMNHSWGFLKESEFQTHPEWFRMDEKGTRVKGPWPNLGNPEVRRLFIEWAVKASNGGKKAISFSPPDDHREDFSPEAKQYDNPEAIDQTSGRVSMTDRFLGIVNEAAGELRRLNPDAPMSGFYAYSDYTLPPTRPELAKLAPNICVWVAPIRYTRFHPIGHPCSPSAQDLAKLIDGWSSRASAMGLRTYNYNLADLQVPFSKISTWAHDLPYLHARGFIGANFESFDEWELYGPHTYLQMRLAYDPRLDPWEIMADYWHTSYGPAAEPMERYWLEIDRAFINLKTDTGSTHSHHHVYTPERLKQLDAWLAEAEALVKGKRTLEGRVALARRGLTRAQYWRKWYDAVNRGDIDGTAAIFQEWTKFVAESITMRHANKYANTYLQRFMGNNTWSAWGHLHPKQADAVPAKFLAVLPDEWKTATRHEIDAAGRKGEPFDVAYDDSSWKTIKTFTDTRNAQGLPEYFGEMWYRTSWRAPKSSPNLKLHFQKADRKVVVHVNGRRVNADEAEAFRGVGIDVTGFLNPDEDNQITVMVRHVPLPEMYLGGLVGPVYLLEKAR